MLFCPGKIDTPQLVIGSGVLERNMSCERASIGSIVENEHSSQVRLNGEQRSVSTASFGSQLSATDFKGGLCRVTARFRSAATRQFRVGGPGTTPRKCNRFTIPPLAADPF